MFHTTFHRNRIIIEDFNFFEGGGGKRVTHVYKNFQFFQSIKTKIPTKMFYTKFHQNRIIDEYFKILSGIPICIFYSIWS